MFEDFFVIVIPKNGIVTKKSDSRLNKFNQLSVKQIEGLNSNKG